MSFPKSLIKIHLQNAGDAFLMSEYEAGKSLFLKLLNVKRNEAYIGQADDSEIRSLAAAIRMPFNDFLHKIREALFQTTSSGSCFLYCLDEQNGKYIFKWKITDEEETIINLGNVMLKKSDYVFIFSEVLQSVSDELQKLNLFVQNFKEELSNSKSQLSDALKQLSAANNIKEIIEKELYSKFVLVLNEKKRKIRELESASHSGKNTNPKKKKIVLSSENSDDSSDAMDALIDIHKPSSSKMGKRSSFIFVDGRPNESFTQSKIRKRNPPASKVENVHSIQSNLGNNNQNITTNDDEGNESDDSLLDLL